MVLTLRRKVQVHPKQHCQAMQLSEYDQGEAYLQGTNVVSVSLLEELRDAADATLVGRARRRRLCGHLAHPGAAQQFLSELAPMAVCKALLVQQGALIPAASLTRSLVLVHP